MPGSLTGDADKAIKARYEDMLVNSCLDVLEQVVRQINAGGSIRDMAFGWLLATRRGLDAEQSYHLSLIVTQRWHARRCRGRCTQCGRP